ncbi:hypothetical protein HYH03_016008 [Edaphochlamys debaryana]|uniref:Enhancer of mRNA-decapping protein 4 C-terminal domain-containing protein n=1 Tax=Edaphochlamys debaryana TaxID=47281 RepID=A0A835XIB5_9CHLO|nr:hypothetical protein HYH03_016008 [Edaphochlamys debaryana]|eukprot:KAG2485222.1 hypothetical protein HYH03_016008 [Edaphochlamys debaryana]
MGFELMGWLKQAEANQAATPESQPAPPASPAPAPPAAAVAPGAAASTSAPAPAGSRIAAPHSQAAAALAAALSSGSVPDKKRPQPHGLALSPLQDTVQVDRHTPEDTPALVVSKIANVKSEISKRHGHAIAVDASYIVYGLKAGQIRILNRHTGARTLLKDHAAPVTDLSFFRHDAERCLLASVDTTGQVHVRKVIEEDTGGEDTVRDEILARHELPIPVTGPTAHPLAHLAWHPAYDFVLCVAAGDSLYFINVPPTQDVAAAPEYASPVVAAKSGDGAVFTSVAFSPGGDLLAAGDSNGAVSVWALSPDQMDPALIQPLAVEPDMRFQAYGGDLDEPAAGGAAVASLHWLGRGGGGARGSDDGADGGGGGGGAGLTLLTGDGVNAHLKLWTINLSAKPACTHALRLASAAASPAFFNHLEAQPLFDCVVLANELRTQVYVLRVDMAAAAADGAADASSAGPTFSYVSEFSVAMPILSCTLVPETCVDEVTECEAFHMYTIQPEAVQQYTLVPAQCFPLPESAAADDHVHAHGHAATHGGGHSAAGGADGAAAAAAAGGVRDPIAALLALQKEREASTSLPAAPAAAAAASGASSTATQPPLVLTSAPSDVSDATSRPAVPAAAAVDSHPVPAVVPAATPFEAPLAATVAAAGPEPAAVKAAHEPLHVHPPPGPSTLSGARPSLLTPSQLLQAAAAARSAAGGSVGGSSTSGGGAANPALAALIAAGSAGGGEDAYSTMTTAGGDNESSSLVGSSRSQSIGSNMTPSLSNPNLAEAEAAAEAIEAAAAAAADDQRLEAAAEAAGVDAVAEAEAPPQGKQAPAGMPPPPSANLVRRISATAPIPYPVPEDVSAAPADASTTPPAPVAVVPAEAPLPPPSGAASPSAALAAVAGAAAAGGAGAGELASQLSQLVVLQQQMLEQMASNQREVLKVVRAEAKAAVKAAADAAASRAADAVARRAADERRKEAAEAQKAVLAAVAGVSKDLSQRVADAAAATTAAVKAAIGPAVRAAVAEALPAALSAGATATALERALGSQLGSALPKAVSDGLGGAFGSQVVPPLERATAAMFSQMEAALRSGLDTHLAPLQPLGGLGGALKDAAQQINTAAKGLKGDAAAATAAADKASRAADKAAAAATSAAATAAAAPVAAAAPAAVAPAPPAPAPVAAAPAAVPPAAAGRGAKGGPQAASGSAGKGSAAAADAANAAAAAVAAASAAAAPSKPSKAQAAPAPSPAAAPAPGPAPAPAAPPAPAPVPAPAPTPAPASAAPPPAPASADAATQELILGLIRSGDLDGAFARVLERQDLPLIVWTCAHAGGEQVLAAEPCPLGQPTLLSLLTFLCFDLTADVDAKLGWIEAILKRLDIKDPGLAPHIRQVLDNTKGALVPVARTASGPTAQKAKQGVHQTIGLIAMLS